MIVFFRTTHSLSVLACIISMLTISAAHASDWVLIDDFKATLKVSGKTEFNGLKNDGTLMVMTKTGPAKTPYGNGGLQYDDLHISQGINLQSPIDVSKVAQTNFVQYDALSLLELKRNINFSESNEFRQAAYKQLLLSANAFLAMPAPSVTQKLFTPPSDNKHDYVSISRYWWPNPAKANGLPWIRKDGITNPSTQTDDVDRKRLGLMARMVHKLSLAYYLSGNEDYAKKTAQVLRTWFIAPETKMNPHLQFAQSVPGNPKGRRSGILDGRLIPQYVLDAITIISASSHWTSEDTKATNEWLGKYLTWLTQSKLGKAGAQQTNNHGSWYFFQVASLAYYLNEPALLRNTIEQVKASFEYQFDGEGKQAHELARTRSFFYSAFNLNAITSVASIADKVNQSFWHYRSSNGASLEIALDFLLPAARGGDWPYQTKGVDPMAIAQLLVKFDKQFSQKEYGNLLRNIIEQAQQTKNMPAINGKYHVNTTLLDFALFTPQYMVLH